MSKTLNEMEFTIRNKQYEGSEPSSNPLQFEHDKKYERIMGVVESIQEDRQNDYGDAKVSHQSIANFWNEYINRKVGNSDLSLDATDAAVMLSLMKVSRLAYKRKEDSFVDFASYADFASQFESGE